ncbi:MAG: hypothetical protein ACT4O4_06100 [Nitrospiraceae bacterium]
MIVRSEPRRARQALALHHALEFPVVATADVFQQACELSASLNQHLFDTRYHAVAFRSHVSIRAATFYAEGSL